ncbi:hypothetical protein C922_04592 [Plasmodium inui San Antonio 1]|uniref:Uncharacterized protein n=1 Tax=Plasmodium inui San Antonio 1 TaxID=1237626 RepID=W6ZWD1_9APIC|nr:hypothetical protein C922_04592 [Plasmodium inui San Antonio 1]EUD65077.1 hypothetical protein C922_04592 [Plasmodium inui San Antonio 1]
MKQYIPDSLSGKVIKLHQKETAEHVIYETTDNKSGTRCDKEKREVHNHEVCVLTDEDIHTELPIPLFMRLPDECKKQ